jgi:uncharacterized membrane protein
MEQPVTPNAGRHLPWLILGWRRIVMAVGAGVVASLLTRGLPDELHLLLTFDVTTVVYIALFCVLMCRALPEDAAEISRRHEPSGLLMLLGVIVVSVISLVAVAAMLNYSSHRPRWVINLHMASSLLAVILSWVLSHIFFALHYLRLYYDDHAIDGKTVYEKGLEYPQRETPDFWDFMYYSFTIAMCYQTSDVSITSVRVRRVTLLHAIFSFLFVSAIIGFVVNVISNIT